MNIFDLYLDKIIILVKKLNNDGSLILTHDNNSIIQFDFKNGFIECESGISLNDIGVRLSLK